MDEFNFGHGVATDNRDRCLRSGAVLGRPDRIAFWAVLVAVLALVAGTASAEAGSSGGASFGGGIVADGPSTGPALSGGADLAGVVTPGCPETRFGKRTLKRGDCGDDVETLNWILRSRDLGTPLLDDFDGPTATAVRAFQRDAEIPADGVVESKTAGALINAMPSQISTYYGPGFYGNETACGQTLTRRTVGVAHKALPCGSKVVVRYKGRFLRTRVIDRGPYANNAKWDLTAAAATALRFTYTDEIRVAKLAR